MEEGSHELREDISAESALLVKYLIDKHSGTVTEEQVDAPSQQGIRNINWVTSEDFTPEVGMRQISEYIQTWELPSRWLYSLDFLISDEGEDDTFYHYRARFSTPTRTKPILGTARVSFLICTSNVEPRTSPVEVLFAVESNRLVHSPGRTRFREKWLEDIIESKTLLHRAVDL